MTSQRTMFDDFSAAERTAKVETFTDTRMPEPAKPRIGGQNGIILDRLRIGKATNMELEKASGSRRINSRIADLRKFLKDEGLTIRATALDTVRGLYQYEIVSEKHQ